MLAIPTISRCLQCRDAADEWFKDNDPEGVVFGYEIIRMTDQELLISTLREAGRIIGELH